MIGRHCGCVVKLWRLMVCAWRGHHPVIVNRVRTCGRCDLHLGELATSPEDISRAIYRAKAFSGKNALRAFLRDFNKRKR